MPQYTPLYTEHVKAKAHFVDFAGWEMPLHYGSQIEEHHRVRQQMGIFDVSHMGMIDVVGKDATPFLRFLLANDVAKLKTPGRALYSCLLNESGGVIDDLIAYYMSPSHYRLVVNAATREKDFEWIKKQSYSYEIELHQQSQACIIAIQGPEAFTCVKQIFDKTMYENLVQLKSFQFAISKNLLIARTGYTGEDGLEIIAPESEAIDLWQQFVSRGAMPCGLGARDTLRLEAGLNLYGVDMNDRTSPLNSNLAWTVSWKDVERNFIGRKALEKQLNEGIKEQLVGLIMEEPGVLRNHQKVWLSNGAEGEITSGSFSPTLGHAIALVRLPICEERAAYVERRGKRLPVKIVKPPFVRGGKKAF